MERLVKRASRVWRIWITTKDGSDYQELEFPYQNHAYDFAWDWWENDPSLQSLRLLDSADRADPLVLKRMANAEEQEPVDPEGDDIDGEFDDIEQPESDMTPMTTRPHQMPGNGDEETRYDKGNPPKDEGGEPEGEVPDFGEDQEEVDSEEDSEDNSEDEDTGEDEMPDFIKEQALTPIVCRACTRHFAVSNVKLGLRCICGSEDLDLDEEEGPECPSCGASSFAGGKCLSCGDRKTSKTALDIESPSPDLHGPGGAVGDLPMQKVDEFQPQLGLLPENSEFAKPFSEEEDLTPVEAKLRRIANDIISSQKVSRTKARWLAKRVIDSYPVIERT